MSDDVVNSKPSSLIGSLVELLRSSLPLRQSVFENFRARERRERRELTQTLRAIDDRLEALEKRIEAIEKTHPELKPGKRKFEDKRALNPTAPFTEFFASRKQRGLAAGKVHGTIGGNLVKESFGDAGRDFFESLVEYGLGPNDICVDYGCGTLRIGVHVIRYLKPSAYWGLDIGEFLLEEGQALIGQELATEKKPNLRVISPLTVQEVAAIRPNFIFSLKVLQHVHPDELSEYFSNILTIAGSQGRAIISTHWSSRETMQYAVAGWDHGQAAIESAIRQGGGEMILLRTDANKDLSKPEVRVKGDFMVCSAEMARDLARPTVRT